LHTFATKASLLGLLVNPTNSSAEAEVAEAETAAHALGCELLVVKATNTSDIDMAFATLMQRGAGGAVIAGDAFFINSRDQIVALAARNRIPTVYNLREYVQAGGLMSYGADIFDIYRQAGVYSGRMLRGVKPADLPVMLPTKFPLIINLKTARAVSLDIPASMLAVADEVIE
jgi:putative ABC transport system substrate-binding protein